MNGMLIDAITGQIQLFAFEYPPLGWMLCDGSTLRVQEYVPLFAAMGNRYGGDGETTFALPNLVGKEPIPGSAYCICIQGVFPRRW